MLQVPAESAGENNALKIAALGDQVFHLVAMGDPGYVLLDDGAVIESLGDVMAGGSDELDAPGVGCVVRPSPDEGRQKAVMDVDDSGGVSGNEVRGEDLHIAGENDEFDVERVEQGKLLGFGCFAGGRGDGDVFEGNAVESGKLFCFAVVGDNDRDFAEELAGGDALQQVGKAMQVLGTEEGNARLGIPRLLSDAAELPAHLEYGGERGESLGELGKAARVRRKICLRQSPLDAHEKETKAVILVLIGVEDVRALAVEQAGDFGDEAGLVGAVDEQDGAFRHAFQLNRAAIGKAELLPAQGNCRVDLHGGARGNERGEHGCGGQNHYDGQQGKRVAGADVE